MTSESARRLALALLGALVALPAIARPARIPVTGQPEPRLVRLYQIMTTFLEENDVPGAALAVVRRGRLVYAKGFGWADVAAREPVQPDSLFRIASILKPITAAAVLQLAERGKIGLDDRVFPALGLRPWCAPRCESDPRLDDITVRELLTHSAGWDRSVSGDPVFWCRRIAGDLGVPCPPSPQDVVRYAMALPLDAPPGSAYSYSNLGYCVLGRVIEKASGEPYEDYVRKEVLAPLGITRMRLGHTLPASRAPGEVRYYASGPALSSVFDDAPGDVPPPYGAFALETMDANGGWIASAVDLVRFAAALDDEDTCPILGRRSIEALFARPANMDASVRSYYGCGWNVARAHGRRVTWHEGSLAGVSALLVRRADGIDWALLMNTGDVPGRRTPVSRLAQPIDQALDTVASWPWEDFFDRFP